MAHLNNNGIYRCRTMIYFARFIFINVIRNPTSFTLTSLKIIQCSYQVGITQIYKHREFYCVHLSVNKYEGTRFSECFQRTMKQKNGRKI